MAKNIICNVGGGANPVQCRTGGGMAMSPINLSTLHYVDALIQPSSLTWTARGASLYSAEISTATLFGRNDICLAQVVTWSYNVQWAAMDYAGAKVMIYCMGNPSGPNHIKIRGFF